MDTDSDVMDVFLLWSMYSIHFSTLRGHQRDEIAPRDVPGPIYINLISTMANDDLSPKRPNATAATISSYFSRNIQKHIETIIQLIFNKQGPDSI